MLKIKQQSLNIKLHIISFNSSYVLKNKRFLETNKQYS